MQKNPCRVDDPLQNPIDRETYEDAVSLEDGIYPITTDDSTIISSDMVSHGSGTVEQALNKAGKYTKLWENADPTASFAPQNITLASDDYNLLLIIYLYFNGDTLTLSTFVPKGNKALLDCAFATSAGARSFTRQVSPTNDTTLSVGDAQFATAGTAAQVSNTFLIPIVIYGIKL